MIPHPRSTAAHRKLATAVTGALFSLGVVGAAVPWFGAVSVAAEPSTSTGPSVDNEQWIVNDVTPDSGGAIFLIHPDGTGGHVIIDGPDSAWYHPDWSPDGSTLVVTSFDQIATANADGTDRRQAVTCEPPCHHLDNPAWSPDGTQIAFSRVDVVDDTFRGAVIEVIDVASGARRTVIETPLPELVEYPRWSPDGSRWWSRSSGTPPACPSIPRGRSRMRSRQPSRSRMSAVTAWRPCAS